VPRTWSQVATLRPTIAPAPKVGEADRFVATLTGTQPLVHAPVLFGRSADAPRGLVEGLAEPVTEPEPEPAAVAAPPAPAPAAAVTPPPEPEPPERRLPARPATPAADRPPLTRVTDEQVPLLHPTPPGAPTLRRDRAITAASQPAGDTEGPALAEPQPTERFDSAHRFNLGQSRRLGLGMPISHGSDEPTAGEQIDAEAGEAPPLVHPPSIDRGPQPPIEGEPIGPTEHAVLRPSPARPVSVAPAEPPPPPVVLARPIVRRPSGPETALTERAAPADQAPPLTHRPEPRHPAGESDSGEERPGAADAPVVLPHYRPAPAAPPRPLPADTPALELEVTRPSAGVPADMASAFQATHGVDVGDVMVHRGPGTAAQAQALGAIAFARDEQVFLPEEAGPIDRAEVRGLLAHELTHVVQQRVHGSPARHGPDEASALEAEAQDAERFFRGDTGAPPPRPATQGLTHPPRPATPPTAESYADRVADELVNRGIARRHSDGSLVFGPPPELIEAQVSDAVQRATALAAPPAPPPSPSEAVVIQEWTLEDLQDQAMARQIERDEVDLERDQYLAELVAEENDVRTTVGEPPLHPEVDAYRFAELRAEADRQFGDRYSDLDRDERAPLGGPPATTEPSSAGDLVALVGAIDTWSDEESDRRQVEAAEAAMARRQSAGAEPGGSPADEWADVNRNDAESGRPEMTADDMDLPDVVRRSWELTRMELRHELLIDRERRGWLTDFR
jgi:hypothetical protein